MFVLYVYQSIVIMHRHVQHVDRHLMAIMDRMEIMIRQQREQFVRDFFFSMINKLGEFNEQSFYIDRANICESLF